MFILAILSSILKIWFIVPGVMEVVKVMEENEDCRNGYSMQVINRNPLIFWLNDFLQPGEAESIISLTQVFFAFAGK